MLALHVILAIISIIMMVVILMKYKKKKYTSTEDSFLDIVILLISLGASGVFGGLISSTYYYRDNNKPDIEDVNNGYAFIDQVIEQDTTYLKIKWQGSNKRNEREINNINKVNHHGFKVKR